MLAEAAARRSAAIVEQRYAESQTGPARQRPVRPSPAPAVQVSTQPIARPTVTSARVPILMYHHIADAPPDADAVRRDLSVSPAAFARQLDYLMAQGYRTISLGELADHLSAGAPLPGKPIILTFDDGYDDNFTHAYPALRARNLAATFFVLTDFVGQAGYMTWPQVVAMNQGGQSIGAHGRTHWDLSVLGPGDTAWQTAGSKAVLEEKLGRAVDFYCYPSGRYTAQTVSILAGNGYRGAVSTANGATQRADGLFDLQRIRIRGSDTLEQFANKVKNTP
jgi:peptidoglycan/xylan/chitin deacetylase (PgdA/CDA1 family)